MGWWSDFRDTVTAPVRAAVQILTAPVDIANSLIHGESVSDTLKDQIKEIGEPVLKTVTPLTGLAGSDTGQTLLRNSTLDKLTLGVSSDFAGYSHGLTTLSNDLSISKDDKLSALRLAVKGGVIVGTAGVASAVGATTGEVIGAVGVAGNALRGDASGLVSALGLPDLSGLSGSLSTVNNFLPGGQPAQPGQPTVSEQAGSSSGYRSLASAADSGGSSTTLLLAGAGLAAYLLLRGKK